MARIAFLQKTCWDFIGVMSISAVLKAAGHQCDVFIETEETSLERCILDYKPDLVAFSVTTNDYHWSLKQARKIKSVYNTHIIFGGIHPTIFPEIIIEDAIDIICRGEGEYSMLELANAISLGEEYSGSNNLWLKKSGKVIKNPLRPFIRDLDSIPLLDRELYYKYASLKNDPARNIMITRGCPYPCTFCFNHQINKMYITSGNPVRRRSIEGCIEELKQLTKYRTRIILFWDDTFTLDKKWLLKFLNIYRDEIGLPFFCNARADHLDRETVACLKWAGAHTVDFGIETGSEERRKFLLKKNISNREYLDAAQLLKEYGICINAENMLAIPGETIETAWETLEFNRKIMPTYAWCSIFQPYQGLLLTETAVSQGLIKEGLKGSDRLTFYESSPLNMPHISEFCNLQKLFNVAVKCPHLDFLIKLLIKLPLKWIYLLTFLISYGFGIKKIFNLTYLDVIRKGFVMLKSYFNLKLREDED